MKRIINIPKVNDDPFARYKREVISLKLVKGFTILENINSISKSLERTEKEIISYIAKSLGTNSTGSKIRGNFSEHQIEERIEEFIVKKILCQVCGNPETVNYVNKGKEMRRCKACGNNS